MLDYIENNSLAPTDNYNYIKTQMDTDSFLGLFYFQYLFSKCRLAWKQHNLLEKKYGFMSQLHLLVMMEDGVGQFTIWIQHLGLVAEVMI